MEQFTDRAFGYVTLWIVKFTQKRKQKVKCALVLH
jgi:hypothetical protein